VRLSQKPTRPRQVSGGDKQVQEKWRVVHGRKERLEYTAERLALEVEQKVIPRQTDTGTTIAHEYKSFFIGIDQSVNCN
jgi:hypothetical protein